MKHINSIIMSLVTSMIVLMPSNVALAQPTGGDGGTTGGDVTGGDGSTVSSPISIDGDFSDWAALEQSLPNACVSVSADDNALYTGIYKAQFFVNGDSLFFYIEYSNSNQVQEAGTNYVTDMIHIMLHTGGLSTMGTTNYNDEDVWSDLANVRIFGSPRTQFANAYILVYQETDQTWETVQLPVLPISACTPVEEVTNDHAKTEGAIALSLLPVQIKELKVGVIGVETDNGSTAEKETVETETVETETVETEAVEKETVEKETVEKEKADMTAEEMISSILECDAETSRALIGTMEGAGIPGVKSVELWSKKANTILLVTGSDERQYYVKVGRGYFISEIRQDAADGKRIYRAIQ